MCLSSRIRRPAALACWPMWTRGRPRCPRRCCMSAGSGAPWDGWTTGTPIWTPMRWSGSGASPFSPSRRGWKPLPGRSSWWTPRGMWIFPPRPSAPCRFWTVRCWSSAAPTACRPTPSPSGGCWSATMSQCSSSSTKWIWRGPTGRSCCLPCRSS